MFHPLARGAGGHLCSAWDVGMGDGHARRRAGFFGLFVLTGIRNAFVKREAAYLSLSLPGTKADLSL